jgi:Nif-specific regulatory protein
MSDDALRAERDLYLQLLELGSHDALEPFLDEALGTMCAVTGAKKGYLALGDSFFAVRGGADVGRIQKEISSGIVAAALKDGKTISTASALEDPRFKDQKSVQAAKISAVLAAPVGGLGVLYLQDRSSPGPFTEGDVRMVEAFAAHVAPLARRLVKNASTSDATEPVRAKLESDGIAGRSRALAKVLEQLVVAAGVDMNVLFVGESGTGKTELARVLHRSSKRAAKPFVDVNCAAIPETLFEAEIFGAEKGAHSTATKRMPGKIAAAQGGTLLLDEVGEMPLAIQAKLLGFLQSKRYWPLGGEKELEADVRVMAATNADLEKAVREKRFREDLFYRLSVLVVRVPPLRERRDDVALIAEQIAATVFEEPMTLSWDARAALANKDWPGNVRQLWSLIHVGAAHATSEHTTLIEARHLFPDAPKVSAQTYQDALREFQRDLLSRTLAETGSVSDAARKLDLSRSHFYELMKALGVKA